MAQFTVPVLALIGVLVSSRNWPTLGRRVRDHAALIKDMPADISTELRALVTDEIAELVRRDRRRLDPLLNRYANALRGVGLSTAALLAAAVGGVFVTFTADTSTDDTQLETTSAAALTLTALLGVAAIAGIALSVASRRRYRRVRADLDAQRESALAAQRAAREQREAERARHEAGNAARQAAGLPPLMPLPPVVPPRLDPRAGRQRKPPKRVAGQRPPYERPSDVRV